MAFYYIIETALMAEKPCIKINSTIAMSIGLYLHNIENVGITRFGYRSGIRRCAESDIFHKIDVADEEKKHFADTILPINYHISKFTKSTKAPMSEIILTVKIE